MYGLCLPQQSGPPSCLPLIRPFPTFLDPLQEAPSLPDLTSTLLEEAYASSPSEPWSAFLPLVTFQTRSSFSSPQAGTSEADYRALIAWATAQLFRPPKGELPLQAAFGTMRILASVSPASRVVCG